MNKTLTSLVKSSGCAAKLPAKELEAVLASLPKADDPLLVGGYESNDDALAYRLGDGRLLLQTVDFFPPMFDDPYVFGQVAAANALSDVYAMGGKPAICMNIVCFPSCLPIGDLQKILQGGQSKVAECGAVIAGGHTISDPTPKYGLSVTGFVDEDKLWKNDSAQAGDLLVLTKSIGVGILMTALKAKAADEKYTNVALKQMTTLNKYAQEAVLPYEVHSATDITGFSLLGHSSEMALASGVQIILDAEAIPVLDGTAEYAIQGYNPGGLYHNRDYIHERVTLASELAQQMDDILYCPETSGGLLLSMEATAAKAFSKASGYPIIGRVEAPIEDRTLITVN